MEIGEKSIEILRIMMENLIPHKMGKEFVEESLEVLTRCISEIIKAGYCHSHYKEAMKKINCQLEEDLKENDH